MEPVASSGIGETLGIIGGIVAAIATGVIAVVRANIAGTRKRKHNASDASGGDSGEFTTRSQAFSLLPQVLVVMEQVKYGVQEFGQMQKTHESHLDRIEKSIDLVRDDIRSTHDAIVLLGPEIRHLREAIDRLIDKIT